MTQPTSAQATTQSTAQPLDDVQLQAAINTMLGVLVFENHPPAANGTPVPPTNPTTMPLR